MGVVKVVFLGTAALAVTALRRLVGAGHAVSLVITQPDRPAGRGRALVESAVKIAAGQLGLPILQPSRASVEALDPVREIGPDVIVVAAYGEILSRELLALAKVGGVNIHPSLLPRLRGATPVPTAILRGDSESGVTIIRVTPRMDAGPILGQVIEPINHADTAETLMARLSNLGADLLIDVLRHADRGTLAPRQQDHLLATYARQFTRDDGRADWSRPSVDLWRAWRAFQPWPGLWTTWNGRVVKFHGVWPLFTRGGRETGVLDEWDGVAAVGCGVGALRIDRVQLEGRAIQPIADFLRGHSVIRGARLGE
ncbi:MAG: methionyl-tRNA formyltransferase [Chloroflexota bacterium]|nr:MAG: methionyl-tRNA formyltransferase [Chloroflexota bacterium]